MRQINSKELITIFAILLGLNLIMASQTPIEWGSIDFFQRHGALFLLFITFFPRLTLLFSSVPFGGFFWWLGFFFYPRLLVATLATITYLQTNPLLVAISWFVALTGEVFEKRAITNRSFVFRTHKDFRGSSENFSNSSRERKVDDANTFEAEFKKVDD